MNRRGFLKLFAGAAVGAVVVPKVSYFFAPQGGWQPPQVWYGVAGPKTLFGLEQWPVERAGATGYIVSSGMYKRLLAAHPVLELKSLSIDGKSVNIDSVRITPSPYLRDDQVLPESLLKWEPEYKPAEYKPRWPLCDASPRIPFLVNNLEA